MRGPMIVAIFVITLAMGCGDADLFTPGTGGSNQGAGATDGSAGAPGTPRFEADCSSGPLDAPRPDCQPAVLPSTGDPAADCVNRINQLRWECQCLPPLERWTGGERCADQHAQYDSTRAPHSGFRDGICEPGGWAQNECPGWGSTDQVVDRCLQMMWDEGPGEPFSEHGHYINMSNPSYSAVACGFHETSDGQIWAIQNFQ